MWLGRVVAEQMGQWLLLLVDIASSLMTLFVASSSQELHFFPKAHEQPHDLPCQYSVGSMLASDRGTNAAP